MRDLLICCLWGVSWYLCIKVSLLFLVLVLVRITVPRLRVESLSKFGWVAGLAVLSYIAAVYGVVWFIF
jgi:NADH:ubiquinone oxidoreductase subunit H